MMTLSMHGDINPNFLVLLHNAIMTFSQAGLWHTQQWPGPWGSGVRNQAERAGRREAATLCLSRNLIFEGACFNPTEQKTLGQCSTLSISCYLCCHSGEFGCCTWIFVQEAKLGAKLGAMGLWRVCECGSCLSLLNLLLEANPRARSATQHWASAGSGTSATWGRLSSRQTPETPEEPLGRVGHSSSDTCWGGKPLKGTASSLSREGTFRASSQGQNTSLPRSHRATWTASGSRDVTSLVLAGRATSHVPRARARPAEPQPGQDVPQSSSPCTSHHPFRGSITGHEEGTLLLHAFVTSDLFPPLKHAGAADVSRACVQLLIWNICMSRWFPLPPLGTGAFLSLLYFTVIYRSKFKRAGARVSHPDALPHPHEKLLVSVQLQLLASPPASLISVPLPHLMTNNNELLHSLTDCFISHTHRKTYTHSNIHIHTPLQAIYRLTPEKKLFTSSGDMGGLWPSALPAFKKPPDNFCNNFYQINIKTLVWRAFSFSFVTKTMVCTLQFLAQ